MMHMMVPLYICPLANIKNNPHGSDGIKMKTASYNTIKREVLGSIAHHTLKNLKPDPA